MSGSTFAFSDDNPDVILIDGDISKTLTKFATDANYEVRREFAGALLHILRHQPLEDILNNIHDFIAAILMVSDDKSSFVRTSFVEQIPYIFLQCHEHACPDLEHYLYDRLLQIVLNYLQDEDCEVRREAFSALQLLLEKYVLDKKRIEEIICPAILCPEHKIHYESMVEFNINAITFMGRIAPIIGSEKTEELFLKNFLEMCKSKINSVRRTCANIFPTISYVLGTSITETKLLDTFFLLCDDVFWGVRKACAESIALISLICTLEYRKNHIAPVVLKLANDNNKWVACATFKILGQVIASFAYPCITGLAYSYNGELHITNPVESDFRDQSDPRTIANYELYLNMLENSDNNTAASTDANCVENVSKNSEEVSSSKKNSEGNLNYNDGGDGVNKDNVIKFDFNDEALSSEEIANLIVQSKSKLVRQINDAMFVKPRIFKNIAWDYYEKDSSNDNEKDNDEILKNIAGILGTRITTHSSLLKTNELSSSNDKLQNILEPTLSCFVKDDDSIENSKTIDTNSELTNNEITSSINTSNDDTRTTDTATINTDQINFYKTNPVNNSFETWENPITDNNNSSTGDISNNINQNSNISETKGRRRTGLLVQAHSFWRKNTPTDLSSIIKKAIHEGQESKSNYSQQQPQLSLDVPSKLKNEANQSLALQTPSCNSEKSNVTEEELSKLFKTFDVTNRGLSKNCKNSQNNICIDFDNNTEMSSDQINNDAEPNEIDLNEIINEVMKTSDLEFSEYNSFKFWHIDPDLPLDNNILEKENRLNTTTISRTGKENETVATTLFKYQKTEDLLQKLEESSATSPTSSTSSKFKPPKSFQQDIVPVGILESYVTMVLYEEEEIKLNCAYNFPAVVFTLGKSNWHILKSLLQYLCDDIDWKVRKTIALSIDLLAMILGKEIATKDLVPIYLGFFKDLDEVKIEAIRNFANFLKAINQPKHEEILSNIGVCLRVDSKTNWRIKEDLAKQICLLIKMYNSINNHDSLLYLTSLAGFFLEDKVSCVREIAADAMAEIIRISNSKQREAIVKYFLVREFANSNKWRKRQTFLNIFYKLIKCEEPLVDLLHLIFYSVRQLSYDSVPNIRLLVAKNLVQFINISEKSNNVVSDEILQVIRRLRSDEDRDVRELFDAVDYLKAEEDIVIDETQQQQQSEQILENNNETDNKELVENNNSKNMDETINLQNIINTVKGNIPESYSAVLKAAPSSVLAPPPLYTESTEYEIEQQTTLTTKNTVVNDENQLDT